MSATSENAKERILKQIASTNVFTTYDERYRAMAALPILEWDLFTEAESSKILGDYPQAHTDYCHYWRISSFRYRPDGTGDSGEVLAHRNYDLAVDKIKKWNHMYPTHLLAVPSWEEYRAATRSYGMPYEKMAKKIGYRPKPLGWTNSELVKGAWV